jgi:hypothetical protein
VRRQWNDYRKALYRVKDINGLHWDLVSGGIQARAPQYYLAGYVQCDAMLEGDLAHSGVHGSCPHSIKVFIIKKDNDPRVFEGLAEGAGEKPSLPPSCGDEALRLIAKSGTIEGPRLRKELEQLGYHPMRIGQVLPRLEREGLVAAEHKGRMKVYRRCAAE